MNQPSPQQQRRSNDALDTTSHEQFFAYYEKESLSERYVLEVSSPGVERPLVKRRDYERFAGREIAIKTGEAIGDLGKRIEGVLRGINDRDVVELDVQGRTVEVDRDNIRKAHLVYRWGEEKKPGR